MATKNAGGLTVSGPVLSQDADGVLFRASGR